MVQRTKMLTEENPEAFASPEQKPEDGSKNKKRKKKKKNNEDSAQPNQLPQPQVCSEPLVVVTPNPEIKSNEESSLPKKKRQHKKKNSINAEVAQPNREEPKPSFNLEIKKEAEPVGVSVEGAETITGKEHKSEIGKLDEVVIVENAVKHDQDHYQEQLHTVDTEKKTGKLKRKRDKSELYGSQSNEPGETVVQTSIIDREVPPVDQTIPGNSCPVNLSELENEYLDKIWMERKRVEAGSIAERFEGNNRVKVTNAPHYQHGRSSMICWACRETDHTMQQCQKLKHLSSNEEICFFCGEIGHSLRICSVYKEGGGRFARCLFCDAHGHFSNNCPGNVPDTKVQLPPVEAGKSRAKVTTEKGEIVCLK